MLIKWLIPAIILVPIILFIQNVDTCNEAVCGSMVSKCLLTKSCNCDFKDGNCTCCKECFNCLSYLYNECCSCVDMCPKPNATFNKLSKKSYVEDFEETIPGLFNVLTESPDTANRWNSTTYPIDFDGSQFSIKEIKLHMQTSEQEVIPKPDVITVNCTVAFWSQCMSWTKCKSSCQSMGASSFRWFHDGCCECVGKHCINYGINESRCNDCPLKDDPNSDEDITEDDLDYGEEDYDFTNEMDMNL